MVGTCSTWNDYLLDCCALFRCCGEAGCPKEVAVEFDVVVIDKA